MIIFGAGNVYADETIICTNGHQERMVSVIYQDQDTKVPCDVEYTKDGQTQTLWHADNEYGYCQDKAEEFIQKLNEWGWFCGDRL